ncbi:MAG: leucine-rich repeat domain-containing protein, partial [Candidatus Neomarinimicrobiota bacterium]
MAPTNLIAAPGDQQVSLTWDANTEADLAKYRIYRDTASPASTLIDSVVGSPPDTFYTDTGLSNGQEYFYRISAVDEAGNASGYSSEDSATPVDVTPPPFPPPASLIATDGTVKNFQKISDTAGDFTATLDDDDQFGVSVAALGDLDGDGVTDLAVGAYADDDGGIGRGAVYVLFMQTNGTVKSCQKISDTEGSFTAVLDDVDGFGVSLVAIGDLDGDGVTDLAVGACYDDDGGTSHGAVYVLFMQADGTVKTFQKISATEGSFTATLDDLDYFGVSVACLGDLDGDGVTDLAVGAHHDDDGGADHGAVYILFMNTDGTVKSFQKISDTAGNFTATLNVLDSFGASVTGLGDLDGDEVMDLAVGAYADDDGGIYRGAAYVLFMQTNGTVKSYQKISDTEGNFTAVLDDYDYFGGSLAAVGDLDDDGITDLAVGSYYDDDGGTDYGAWYVLFMQTSGTVKSFQKISNTAGNFTATLYNGDNFGKSLTAIGDLDGDSVTDLAVGAWYDEDGGPDRGAVYVLFLQDAPPATPANLTAAPGDGQVTITWDANSEVDLAKYCIYRDTSSPASTLIDSVVGSPPDTFYMDSNVSYLLTYYYRVTAVDNAGNESGFSSEDNATPLPTPLQQDSLALVVLYDSTGGPGWMTGTNWLTGPVSTWHGVTVETGRITMLELRNNNLSGLIPTAIGNLTGLTFLSLRENQITGDIPVEIGNLSDMTGLDLGWNQLTGSIPSEISSLASLSYLYLSHNQITGNIPTEIGNLASLTSLYVSYNQLTGPIPTGIGSLSSLTTLKLARNQLTGPIPTEIGSLTSLTQLLLGGNQLTGPIPTEIGSLTNLTDLSLWGNLLTGPIPSWIGSLLSLTKLKLSDNQLTGPIPTEISSLTSLTQLLLGGNQLTGPIPSEIGSLTNLTELSLASNQLTGLIPNWIGSLNNLTYLNLGNNQLTGTIPDEIGNLTSLERLHLGGNQLTGHIPIGIGSLANLQEIGVHSNHLTGPIPPEIGNLSALTSLSLMYNQLSGAVPPEIANLPLLQILELRNNQLTDLSDLSGIDSLNTLTVEYNQLTFEDIEPNIGVPRTLFTYAPQDSVGIEGDTTATLGNPFTLVLVVGGQNNQYQWRKDGVDITGANASTYNIPVVDYADTGAYSSVITNSLATDLILYSRPTKVTVVDLPPAAPTNLTAAPGNGQVTLTWDANTEADLAKYRIYRDTTSQASTLIDSVVGTPPDTSYTDIGLTNGQEYFYRITAVDSAGNESENSNEVSATPVNYPPVITSPTTASATEDEYFSYHATAADPEDSTVILTFDLLPSWIEAAADSVFGTPLEGAVDTSFRVIASDGELYDTLIVTVTVTPVNDPPVITSAPTVQATEDK